MLMHNGWPVTGRQTARIVHKYSDMRDEYLINGLILKSFRVIIPLAFNDSFLCNLHKKYMGIVKCHLMVKALVYWPGIQLCPACIRH